MAAWEEWVYWKDEDQLNLNMHGGLHPKIRRSSFPDKYTKLYYCYYTPEPGQYCCCRGCRKGGCWRGCRAGGPAYSVGNEGSWLVHIRSFVRHALRHHVSHGAPDPAAPGRNT